MIVGNGQIANAFNNVSLQNTLVFASGVSDSNCNELKAFERERNLLMEALRNNGDKSFVYFSSCALSAHGYKKNDYYTHKQKMENLVKDFSDNFYIFRLPQLFGDLFHHKTLINFIYMSINHDEKFKIFDEAYRYVIEINDMKTLVYKYLELSKSNLIVDLANPYRYKVTDIVRIFESLMHKKANYELVKRSDQYFLDLTKMEKFIDDHDIQVDFGENYLREKIAKKLNVPDRIST